MTQTPSLPSYAYGDLIQYLRTAPESYARGFLLLLDAARPGTGIVDFILRNPPGTDAIVLDDTEKSLVKSLPGLLGRRGFLIGMTEMAAGTAITAIASKYKDAQGANLKPDEEKMVKVGQISGGLMAVRGAVRTTIDTAQAVGVGEKQIKEGANLLADYMKELNKELSIYIMGIEGLRPQPSMARW